MSYPYPQDRTRDKQTKGEEPYEDAREAYRETEAAIERDAPSPHEQHTVRTDEEQERDAEERFERIGEEVAEHGTDTGDGS